MIEQLFPTASARQRLLTGPLAPHIEGIADLLNSQGYARKSIAMKLRLIGELSRSLHRRQLPITALNESLIHRFLDCRRRRRFGPGSRATGKMLLCFLRTSGDIPSLTDVVDPSPLTHLLHDYERFLSSERGLSQATLDNYLPAVRHFLTDRFGSDVMELEALCPQDAHRFILRLARKYSRSRSQLLVTALRSFFRFLFQRGDITSDLAGALPSVASWRLSHLPESLKPEEVERLLAHCDLHSTIGRRDFAILLFLARLDLRAGEVVAMMLEDIDWESGVLTVHGKGNREEQLPLPEDVGTLWWHTCASLDHHAARVVYSFACTHLTRVFTVPRQSMMSFSMPSHAPTWIRTSKAPTYCVIHWLRTCSIVELRWRRSVKFCAIATWRPHRFTPR